MKNPRGGFTLIELLIGLALSLIIMSVVTYGFFTTSRATNRGLGTNELHEQAASVYSIVREDMDNRDPSAPWNLSRETFAANTNPGNPSANDLRIHTFDFIRTRTEANGAVARFKVAYVVTVAINGPSVDDGYRTYKSYSFARKTWDDLDNADTYPANSTNADQPTNIATLVAYSDPNGGDIYLPEFLDGEGAGNNSIRGTLNGTGMDDYGATGGLELYTFTGSEMRGANRIFGLKEKIAHPYLDNYQLRFLGQGADGSKNWYLRDPAVNFNVSNQPAGMRTYNLSGAEAYSTLAPAFLQIYIPFARPQDGIQLSSPASREKRVMLDSINPDHPFDPEHSSYFVWHFKL